MHSSKNVCVVVLGDIGRSPRMQYHSLSLAEHGCKVDLVGYGENEPFDHLKETPLIRYHYLIPYPTLPLPRFLNFFLKQFDTIIVQNPPAVPSLLVCWVYSKIINANLVIDWHNYAYTIMALSVGSTSILVKVTKQIEGFVGKRAFANFCVTNAMRKDLQESWSIKAITIYDRPPEKFRTLSVKEKYEIWLKLSLKYNKLSGESAYDTVFTTFDEIGNITWKKIRPGLIVSSTSWTEDEDFSILFQALQEYEDVVETSDLPPLICIITGKGPLKQYYCEMISQCKWKHVNVITPWLESEDYPLLLGSADLGICLHTSSSGFDLPMKVVDMFGCGIPVCAYDFNCLEELVIHAKNGFKFKTAEELSIQLQKWFQGFPTNQNQIQLQNKFKTALEEFQNLRWRENWNNIALQYFN